MGNTDPPKGSVFWMPRELLVSKAFMSLSGKAPQVLCIFFAKRKRRKVPGTRREYEDIGNGTIKFTYVEARKKHGISQGQFIRALDQVINHGFIDIVEYGGGLHKSASIYHMSERWERYGEESFEQKTRKKDLRPRHRVRPTI